MSKFSIAIHGGAGTISRKSMSAEKEQGYLNALQHALVAGEAILAKGGTALDAVQAAVVSMEDDHHFNAGKGAVFSANGEHEMDASIMCGKQGNAGAVAGVQGVRNPIELARAIMERSEHVMLAGAGAAKFAIEQGLAMEPAEYFHDEFRFQQWQRIRGTDNYQLDHSGDEKFGTVGAVALDKNGDLAAATSTGGMTNKRYNRIGDSPIIGAGTWAENGNCAISCTGHGEPFIRAVVAHDVSRLMAYQGLSLKQACEEVVMGKLPKIDGDGGLIAVDANGNIEMPFNCSGMYRASKKEGEEPLVAIYR